MPPGNRQLWSATWNRLAFLLLTCGRSGSTVGRGSAAIAPDIHATVGPPPGSREVRPPLSKTEPLIAVIVVAGRST